MIKNEKTFALCKGQLVGVEGFEHKDYQCVLNDTYHFQPKQPLFKSIIEYNSSYLNQMNLDTESFLCCLKFDALFL